jgi:diacylglycerol kinase family enzyme
VNVKVPAGALAVLGALVVGIVIGERAGPGSARWLLLAAGCGLLVTVAARMPRWRMMAGIVAFLMLGAAVMQRALHGLEVSPL